MPPSCRGHLSVIKLSSTMRSLSSSDQDRRRTPSVAEELQFGTVDKVGHKLGLTIGAKPVQTALAGQYDDLAGDVLQRKPIKQCRLWPDSVPSSRSLRTFVRVETIQHLSVSVLNRTRHLILKKRMAQLNQSTDSAFAVSPVTTRSRPINVRQNVLRLMNLLTLALVDI